MKESEDIQVGNNLFKVATMTKWLFVLKPHSVVIPQFLDGKFTTSRGFMVEYTTSDPEILHQWHEMLCLKVHSGLFDVMLEQAHSGLFPFDEHERDLMRYVKGFRCP